MSHTTSGDSPGTGRSSEPTSAGQETTPGTVSGSSTSDAQVAAAARYRLLQLHARGGLGEVYLAHDEELQREVALKRLQPVHESDAGCQRRFLQEAEITGRLEHPGIVPVYGLVRGTDGQPCYAMRFIKGESLRQAIKRYHEGAEGRLTLHRLLRRFIDVCNTMAYAHSHGIIHRDLKPANILLGPFGETLVVDWGLAKRLGGREDPACQTQPSGEEEPMTVQGGVMGTPSYMAPEQAAGENEQVGAHSDIYCLGATLYHLLTGQPPFDPTQELRCLLRQVVRGTFPSPRQVQADTPAPLEAICLKAMALSPGARYPSALEMAADIEHYLDDQPVNAYPEPWTSWVRRWIGRNRQLVTGVASALVVAVMALTVATSLLWAANHRADQARLLAQDNERIAENRRDDAQQSLQTALTVIDRFSTRVSGDPRMREPDLEEMRQQMLQSAVSACQTLLAGKDDPRLQGQMVRIEMQLGQLYRQMGEHARAANQYRQTLDLLVRLRQTLPDDSELARLEAMARMQMGVSLMEDGAVGKGKQALEQALKIQSAQVASGEASDIDHGVLGTIRLNLGEAFRRLGDAEKGKAELLEARKTWVELLKRAPRVPQFEEGLAECLINLGGVLIALNQPDEALVHTEQARKLLSVMVKRDPVWPPYRYLLSLALQNLAKQSKDGHVRRTRFLEARDLLDELARRNPRMTSYQEGLAEVSYSLGVIHDREGAFDLAERSYLLMLEATNRLLAQSPSNERYRVLEADAQLGLGWNHRARGRFPQAEKAFLQGVAAAEKAVQKQPESLLANHRLGWAHNSTGILYRHMQEMEKSEKHNRQALEIRTWLIEKAPNNREYRANVASSCTNLANLYPNRIDSAEAEKLLLRAIDLQQRVVTEADAIDQNVLDFAMSHHNLGNVYFKANRFVEAEKVWAKALTIREELLVRRPNLVPLLNDVGMSHATRAANFLRLKEPKKAEDSFRQAVDVWAKLVKLQPQVQDHVLRLAQYCRHLADLMVDQGRHTDALTVLDRALGALAPWEKKGAAALPPFLREQLISNHIREARTLTALSRLVEARSHWDRALVASVSSDRDSILFGRAQLLALAGEHRACVDDLLDLLGRSPTPVQRFSLASLYGQASSAASEDRNLSVELRRDVADLYARRAIGLLHEVHRAGFFKTERYRKSLREAKALRILHEREDFKKLLAQVEENKE